MKITWLLAAAAVLVALAGSGAVSAHSNPIRFDPGPGTILNAPPDEITGWFSSDLRRDENSFIQVFNEADERVDAGEVELSTDRRQMTVGLQSNLAEGRYLVYWGSSDDADGETTGACFNFYVGQAAADAAIAGGGSLDGGGDCPAGGHDEAAPPESDAALEIAVEVDGSNARLTMMPEGFTPRAPTGSGQDPANGHYHIFLDKVPVEIISGASHEEGEEGEGGATGATGAMENMSTPEGEPGEGGLVENPTMWFENTFDFTDLTPGKHTVAVALMYDDHTPFQPPIIATETFTVEGGSSGDGDDDGIATWLLIVTGGIGLALGVVGTQLVSLKKH